MKNKDLSCGVFFEELIKECMEQRLITKDELEKILYRRAELLKEKLMYYTKNENSSVMVETAESILDGIDYTVGIYLKSLELEMAVDKLKNEDLGSVLKGGEKLIKNKVEKNRMLLKMIKMHKINVNNYSYDDTVEHGLGVFFSKYDTFFKPQETNCDVDYQIPIDIMYYTGIEYIEKYLEIISIENEFCNKFQSSNIKELLRNYDSRYEELLINIFQLVLINALGVVICNKELETLSLNYNDILQIQYELKEFSKKEIKQKFIDSFKKCLQILSINNEKMFYYGIKIIESEEDFIYRNIKEGTLDNVFVISSERDEDNIIRYEDGEKLNDAAFRKLTEKIRQTDSISKKIDIINNNFKSLEDIVDMLEAECIFADEYYYYFQSINEIQITLLWKYVKEKDLENESDEEWCRYLNNYIFSLSKKTQDNIKEAMRKIKFSV